MQVEMHISNELRFILPGAEVFGSVLILKQADKTRCGLLMQGSSVAKKISSRANNQTMNEWTKKTNRNPLNLSTWKTTGQLKGFVRNQWKFVQNKSQTPQTGVQWPTWSWPLDVTSRAGSESSDDALFTAKNSP